MKLFKSPGIVAIGIDDNGLEFGYFSEIKENFFELKSYKYQNLDRFEIFDSIVFNQTLIQSYVHEFFSENKIYKPYIYLYLSKSKKIKESVIACPSASSSRHELGIDEDGAFIWGFDCLGSENNLHYYYVAGMAQELLFQYKLLFSSLPCLLIKITTKNLALLNVNKFIGSNILDLKSLTIENLSNNLILPKIDKFILDSEIKTGESFLQACIGTLV